MRLGTEDAAVIFFWLPEPGWFFFFFDFRLSHLSTYVPGHTEEIMFTVLREHRDQYNASSVLPLASWYLEGSHLELISWSTNQSIHLKTDI